MGDKWRNRKNSGGRDNNAHEDAHGPRADPRAIQARRGDTHVSTWPPQIKGEEPLRDACVDMQHAIPKKYPIYGLGLEIELRDGDEGSYPVLVFHGTETGHELEGVIRPGFAMSTVMLGWTISQNVRFKSESHEILVRYLLDKPEMVWARDYVKAQARAEAQVAAKKEAARRGSVLEALRAKQGTTPAVKPATDSDNNQMARPKKSRGPKIDRSVLENLKDILTVSDGVIEHDGCTIMVCQGGRNASRGWNTVIRITRAAEGHPMGEAHRRALAVHQTSLHHLDNVGVDQSDEKAVLRRKMQDWLRSELMKSGVTLAPPPTTEAVPKGNGNGVHHAQASETSSEGSAEGNSLGA